MRNIQMDYPQRDAEYMLKTSYIPSKLHDIDIEKEKWYMATVAPGLETVAVDELMYKLTDAVLIEKMRGKIFFKAVNEFDYKVLRCVDNIYLYIYMGSIGMTRNDFPAFRSELVTQPFRHIIGFIEERFGGRTPFISNASKVGKHSFTRFEIADQFAAVMADHYHFKRVDNPSGTNTLEFRIDVVEKQFLLFIKLTDAAFRFRGTDRLFSKAALRPPIAHSLVWIARPYDHEVFIDPFCGSGTVLCEREAYPYAQLIGNDHSRAEIDNARANLSNNAQLCTEMKDFASFQTTLQNHIHLYNTDARLLRFDSDYLDTVTTNLPWDKQIQVDDATALYTSFLGNFTKHLKQNGKFILLTSLEQALLQAASQNNLSCNKLYTISLHGTLCGVYILMK